MSRSFFVDSLISNKTNQRSGSMASDVGYSANCLPQTGYYPGQMPGYGNLFNLFNLGLGYHPSAAHHQPIRPITTRPIHHHQINGLPIIPVIPGAKIPDANITRSPSLSGWFYFVCCVYYCKFSIGTVRKRCVIKSISNSNLRGISRGYFFS